MSRPVSTAPQREPDVDPQIVLKSKPATTANQGTELEVDPLDLYASGISTSDYVAQVLPLIRAAVPEIGALLDIGAGGGQLGAALRDRTATWTAIEPAATMQRRLLAFDPPPRLYSCGWREVSLPRACADTVLAANMPAPLTEAIAFLAACRRWARRNAVWVVPAQHGPRGLCFAGCLPREWHGEDETPGVDIVLRALPRADRPMIAARVAWTFSAVIPDLARLSAHIAGRLGWPPDDPRRPDLHRHLATQAVPAPRGVRLSVPRTSAILVWRTT